VLLAKYYSGYKIEKNEMGGACNTYGGRRELHTGFWYGNLRERDHLEDPGVDGGNVKMDLQEVECEGMNWIYMAQDWDSWRTLANVIMSLRVP